MIVPKLADFGNPNRREIYRTDARLWAVHWETEPSPIWFEPDFIIEVVGNPSRLFTPNSLVEFDNRRVGIILRVSTDAQARAGHLADQQMRLIPFVEGQGGIPFVKSWVIHAANPRYHREIREWASENRLEILIFETVDRAIRHYDYGHDTSLVPTEQQVMELERELGAFTLTTLLDPNATHEEVRHYQSERGQRATGGRGKRQQRTRGEKVRNANQYRVIEMYYEGKSPKVISAELGVSESTVYRWIPSRKQC